MALLLEKLIDMNTARVWCDDPTHRAYECGKPKWPGSRWAYWLADQANRSHVRAFDDLN